LRHLRRPRVPTNQPAFVSTLDSRRVLDLLRLGGSLPGGEVNNHLGSLGRIAGHLGFLHARKDTASYA